MAKEKNCKWFFADLPDAAQEIGPNNPTEQAFRQAPYESLIRESIQNSLDAVLDKELPVLVKYEYKSIEGNDFPEFFKLKDHIQGCIDYFPNNPNARPYFEPMLAFFDGYSAYNQQIHFLRISDYNTKGMPYDEENHDSPFYAFVRSVGVSAKADNTSAGSYGFGKAAYYQLSPIRTVMISTCTANMEYYFEGATSLCTHSLEGAKKMHNGYYDDSDGHPISNFDDIPKRFRREEPGTNFDIMGFDMSDWEDALREMTIAVLRNFWMAIYENKLVVEIGEDYRIDKENLQEYMERFFPDEKDTTKKFAYYNPRPYFDAVRLANTSSRFKKFVANLPLAKSVVLYTNRCDSPQDKILQMREQLMKIDGKKTQTSLGVCGVFICYGREGNDALRKMEPAAHDKWNPSLWKINGRVCNEGKAIIKEIDDFIKDSLDSLTTRRNRDVINIKGLDEFLYIPTDWDKDEDLQHETYVGQPTGIMKDEGSYHTTEIPTEDNPQLESPSKSTSTGQVLINRTTQASPDPSGKHRAGHGEANKKTKSPGIPKPGDTTERHEEDAHGAHGIYATDIVVPYRSFSQMEDGKVVHYVVLHSEEEVGNVRLRFYAVGEESDELLYVRETSNGNIDGEVVRDIRLNVGTTRLRVRFNDNMKHSVKLKAEKLHEL